MIRSITRKGPFGRVAALLGVCGLFLFTQGCDALLSVDNPDEILAEDLRDPSLVPMLANSAVGEFQNAFDDPWIWRGSFFTDEQITGINWEQTARLSQRIVRFDEGDASGMFGSISRAIVMADTATSLLKEFVDSPQSDHRVATTLAFAGYSYVYMAEIMCQATIKVSAEIYTPNQVMEMAVPRFQEAIQVAQAANRSDLANLARTGLARAHLWLGNSAQAQAAAVDVPSDFVYWAYYSTNSTRENNTLWLRTTGANHALGIHPNFLNGGPSEWLREDPIVAEQTDPRIQHWPMWQTGHNALSPLYQPYPGRRFSSYNGQTQADGGEPGAWAQSTNIAIADGIEAAHHYFEAAGPGGNHPVHGTTLDFVNARRAYGNMDPLVAPTDAELMAELREQRGRDLFLSGLRLGDLRRWKAQGVGDFFPSGQHPTAEWGQYGDAECYPLPRTEYEGNPNISLP
jgi:hypothetical protein